MNVLGLLQQWYRKHCNGEWEHQYGVHIETLDNPGWLVKIDLTGTDIAERSFRPIEENVIGGWPQSDRWMNCFIRDAVWNGAGDETTLERILSTFLNFAGE